MTRRSRARSTARGCRRAEGNGPVRCHLLTQLPSLTTAMTPSYWALVQLVTLSDEPFIRRISSQFGQPSFRKSDDESRSEHSRHARWRFELADGAAAAALAGGMAEEAERKKEVIKGRGGRGRSSRPEDASSEGVRSDASLDATSRARGYRCASSKRKKLFRGV